MVAVAQFRLAGLSAGIWYLVHSTMATAALFLAVDLIATRRRDASQWLRPAPPLAQAGIVAALFFTAAIGIAGLPPLSGFPGKLAVMQAVRLARYHTGKTHLVRFAGAYHGWWGDVQPGVGNPMPADSTYTLKDMAHRPPPATPPR